MENCEVLGLSVMKVSTRICISDSNCKKIGQKKVLLLHKHYTHCYAKCTTKHTSFWESRYPRKHGLKLSCTCIILFQTFLYKVGLAQKDWITCFHWILTMCLNWLRISTLNASSRTTNVTSILQTPGQLVSSLSILLHSYFTMHYLN